MQVLESNLPHFIAYHMALDDISCPLTFEQLQKSSNSRQPAYFEQEHSFEGWFKTQFMVTF